VSSSGRALLVARAHVVQTRVGEHDVERAVFGHVLAARADHGRELGLPVVFLRHRPAEVQRCAGIGDRRGSLGEDRRDGRKLELLAERAGALFGVGEIVAPDAEHVFVRVQRRMQHGARNGNGVAEALDGRVPGGRVELHELVERPQPLDRTDRVAVDDAGPRRGRRGAEKDQPHGNLRLQSANARLARPTGALPLRFWGTVGTRELFPAGSPPFKEAR